MTGSESEARPVILAVDDLSENLRLLELLLTPFGYSVVTAQTGEEALELFKATPPDVVLLDLVMPGINGYEICRTIKTLPRARHIPVIMLTGTTEHEAYVEAMEAGADDLILRPFNSVLLRARIGSAVRAKQLQDEIIAYQEGLEQRIGERTAELERIQQATVFSLAKLAESRDPETGEHLERIRRYVRVIAQYLATSNLMETPITAEFIEALYVASPLHDIGKVGIPDQILLKPGRLTKHEFEIMTWHTSIGGDTLSAAHNEVGSNELLGIGRDIARHHHERWDGTGYPDGLKGDEIPIEARIVALADVYDALTSRRPYKEPFSHEKAREIILEGAGTQFDERIIQAFLALEAQFREIHATLRDSSAPTLLQRIVNTLADTQACPSA